QVVGPVGACASPLEVAGMLLQTRGSHSVRPKGFGHFPRRRCTMGRRSLKGRGAFTALALVAVVTLVGTSCAKGRTATSGAGVRAYNVFVQKFRYHGFAASFETRNLQLNCSNQESFRLA